MRRSKVIEQRHHTGVVTLCTGLFALIVLGASGDAIGCSCAGGKLVAGPSAVVKPVASTGPVEEFERGEPQVKALWKLGRGLHNLALGLPAELIHNPAIEAFKADTVFGFGVGATEGAFVGLGKGLWRMGAGFLDVMTFPSSVDPWYDPEVLPHYPF